MSYKIEALPPFAKEVKYLAKRYKSLKEDILRLRDELLENPLSGTDLEITGQERGSSGDNFYGTCQR